MNITDAITGYFNKEWKNNISNAPKDGNLVADLSGFIGLIRDMKLSVHPIDKKRLVVKGYEYVGPGDLNLDVYFSVDHLVNIPIDQYLVAGEVLIPWLQKSFLRYFGFDIYRDFADIVITFYDMQGDYDEYVVDVKDTNVKSFYDNPPKYWKETDKKNNLRESVLEEGLFKTKSLYLTFPKPGWETIGGYLMKALGIVTGVFTNTQEAIDVVRKKKKRIDAPLKELVIGSHGDGQHLLMGGGSKGLPVNDLLREVKSLVGSDTTVFFTACYGADFLKQLCLASSELNGHRVYGAAGIYNYISNTAQKGFYSCQMSPRQHNEFYNDSEKFNIVFGSDKSNDYLIQKGFCKRESKAPINWVKNIWT